jgi:Domain of unknown function (DUF4129)
MTGLARRGNALPLLRGGASLYVSARRRTAKGCVRCALCALLLLFISCAGAQAAVSPAEYRARLGQATIALDSLSSFDEGVGERERNTRIASTLREVRRAVPPTLAVEGNGESVEVNNQWLHDALKEYERLPPSDARREEVLRSATERLHALGERLDEVLKAEPGGAESKDEEKARLAAILRRAEYDKTVQESAIARLWERFKRWLRSLFPEREPVEREPGRRIPLVTNVVQIVVIALALAVIAYAAWKLLPRFLRGRGRRKREKREARVVLGERLAPDETASDILAEAEKLARAGDIRGAIRKGYIALLCELGDRKLLRLAQHKTNRDYLRALSDHRTLYGEVRLLTDSFENHWYGTAPGTENDWAAFRMHYRQALEQ